MSDERRERDPHRILIFGAAGVGCSTLGASLAFRFACSYLDTDDFFWLPTDPPFTRLRPAGEAATLLRRSIELEPRCVVGGSLNGWADEIGNMFDVAILLHAPAGIRMRRIRDRQRTRFGSRVDPGGDMHLGHVAFLDWAAGYDTGKTEERNLVLHEQWGCSLPCGISKVDSDAPLEAVVDTILNILSVASSSNVD